MNIQWFSKILPSVISIYETNITLNTIAMSYFESAYSTIIGFDKDSNVLLIKALKKDDVDKGNYSESDLHQISIKASYARINGKNVIKNICRFVPLDFTQKSLYKFYADWDEVHKTLKVDMKKEVE